MNVRELLDNPFTAVAIVGSAVLSLLAPFAGVWELVGSTAGTWFPLIAVSAGTILPEIGLQRVGTQVLLAAAIVYVAVYADRLIEQLEKRL